MEIEYFGEYRKKKPAKGKEPTTGRTPEQPNLDPAAELSGVPGKKRVLLVDDDIQVIHALRVDLEAEGYTVTWATDPTMAKLVTRQWRPDIIITDVMMPELNGFAMIEGIFNSPEVRKVPVIFISGSASENVRPTKKQGVSFQFALLKKPFDMPDLCALVREFLNSTP